MTASSSTHVAVIKSRQNGKTYASIILRQSYRDENNRVQKRIRANLFDSSVRLWFFSPAAWSRTGPRPVRGAVYGERSGAVGCSLGLPCPHVRSDKGRGTREDRVALAHPLRREYSLAALRSFRDRPDGGRRKPRGGARRHWLADSEVPQSPKGGCFDLLGAARSLKRPGVAGCWPVVAASGNRRFRGDFARCASPRKPSGSRRTRSRRKPKEKAANSSRKLSIARNASSSSPPFRKTASRPGHLPQRGDDSAGAWLYGKLPPAPVAEEPVARAAPLPPGDANWRGRKARGSWREFKFIHSQLAGATEPSIEFADVQNRWGDISKALSERPRKRRPQLEKYFLPTSRQTS